MNEAKDLENNSQHALSNIYQIKSLGPKNIIWYSALSRLLISHASKVIHKIFQARFQQYGNWKLPDVQAGFRKGRGTRDQIANFHLIIEKAGEFQKNICFIDFTKAFDCVHDNKLRKILKEMGIPDTLPASWETYMQVKKQQLELDMEQWTGLKLGKEYNKAVYCDPAYLTYMQSTSCEMLG